MALAEAVDLGVAAVDLGVAVADFGVAVVDLGVIFGECLDVGVDASLDGVDFNGVVVVEVRFVGADVGRDVVVRGDDRALLRGDDRADETAEVGLNGVF